MVRAVTAARLAAKLVAGYTIGIADRAEVLRAVRVLLIV